MIIANRSSVSYATDPVAQSLRRLVASSARLEASAATSQSTGAALDIARLYPALFAPVSQSRPLAQARAAAGALAGSVAAVASLMAVFHR